MKFKVGYLCVNTNYTIKSCLELINSSGHNTLLVIDKKKKLIGTLSDGDIRRAILKNINLNDEIKKHYHKKPFKVYKELEKNKILDILLKKQISTIPLVKKNNEIIKIYSNKDFSNKNIYSNSVIIMAGGKGLRMRPFTNLFPKAMLPYNDSTIVEEIIKKFQVEHFNNFFITTGFKSNILKKYLSAKKYKNVKFSSEKEPLGTIGGIKKIEKEISNVFFLTNCDTFIDTDYKNILDFHNNGKYSITILSAVYEKKINYGVCRTNKSYKLVGLDEKPNLKFLINTGFYVMNKKVLKRIPKDRFFNTPDLIKDCITRKIKIGIYPVEISRWKDVGNWEDYIKAKYFI